MREREREAKKRKKKGEKKGLILIPRRHRRRLPSSEAIVSLFPSYHPHPPPPPLAAVARKTGGEEGRGGGGETGDKMQSLYSRVSVYEPPFAFASNWVEWFLRGLSFGGRDGGGGSSGHVTLREASPVPTATSGAGQSRHSLWRRVIVVF